MYTRASSSFSSHNIYSIKPNIFPDKTTNTFFLCFVGKENGGDDLKIYLQKHLFKNLNDVQSEKKAEFSEPNAYGLHISCFQSPKYFLYCLYLTKQNEEIYFNLTKYASNFTNKVSYDFVSNVDDENNFFKCIHYKDEILAIAYYQNFTNVLYPIILFKEFNYAEQIFEDYISSESNKNGIKLGKKEFCNDILLNDFIKLDDDKFVFSAIVLDKQTIYIIVINIFGEKKVKIRYYSIKSFELYHFKISHELRLKNFNNYVALAFSYSNETESGDSEQYSSLILLSYPNSTDQDINLAEYIVKNNLFDFEIDLNKEVKIENNIFGYIFSNIIIRDLLISNDYKVYSSKNTATSILSNHPLGLNENIIIKPKEGSTYYNIFVCTITYYFNITEPELTDYNNYPEYFEGDDDEVFESKEYSGRISNYIITLEEQLTSIGCYDGRCNICYKNKLTQCLNCKYASIIKQTQFLFYRECLDEDTTIVEDVTTDLEIEEEEEETEKATEKITDITTGEATEKLTEKITDIITSETTEKLTEKITDTITSETTEKLTEKNTDIITSETTEKITERTTDMFSDVEEQKHNEETKEEEKCEIEKILLTKYCDFSLNDEQLYDLYSIIKNTYINTDYNREDLIFQSKNAIFEVSKHEDQKNAEHEGISNIDLGPCETRLKEIYGIPPTESLVIYKIDIKIPESHNTFVKYEVYNPIDLTILDLSFCKDINIVINAPVHFDDMTSALIDSLRESGFDFFNENDSFYNDPCSIYTSPNNTDITLADRKQIYVSNDGNISLCQTGCELEYYDSKTRKAKCNCSPVNYTMIEVLDSSYVKFAIKMISDTFIETITNSNFIILKCFNLAFDLSTILSNIGRLCMIIIFLMSVASMLFFYLKDSNNINKILTSFLDNTFHYKLNSSNKEMKKEGKKKKEGKEKKGKKKEKKYYSEKNKNSKKVGVPDGALKKTKTKKIELAPPKRNKKKAENKGIITSKNDNNSCSKIDFIDEHKNKKGSNRKETSIKISKIEKSNIVKLYKKKQTSKFDNKNLYMNGKNNEKHSKKNKKMKSVAFSDNRKRNLNDKLNKKNEKPMKMTNLNDYELDELEYQDALTIDKRTYFQYYWSLLKRKHLFFFTFCPSKDYNFFSIKFSLFLLTFSALLTVTGFFFDNQSMHNIFIDNGDYNILSELPKIIISSIITTFINILLKTLSLTEKNFISVKKETLLRRMIEMSKRVKTILHIKFIFYFLFSHFFLLFFLYFISCFCSIYPNTQLILLYNTIISFGLSMIYPFGIYLIPGIFRISALRAPKKDKKCLYKIGHIISLI